MQTWLRERSRDRSFQKWPEPLDGDDIFFSRNDPFYHCHAWLNLLSNSSLSPHGEWSNSFNAMGKRAMLSPNAVKSMLRRMVYTDV
jgi:hypothetical protein